MAHIEDRGSEFDGSIDVVWKFIQSPEDHGSSHRNRRNVRGEPDGPDAMKTSWEQNVGGSWVKVENRVRLFPPVAMLVEALEGPLAGSKFIFYYTPKGKKTGVDAVGDFHSKMIPAGQLEPAVLAAFEEAYQDDNAGIRKMAGRT
ncbi:MAG TPA: hypothetical protein VEY07_02285 [Thermoplasmata archaeon]|nr:hypothetical protein [Thermoplasmata archaeon]